MRAGGDSRRPWTCGGPYFSVTRPSRASRSSTPVGRRARCSRSPTAAAPATPTSPASRTPSWRSSTRSALGYRYLETDVHMTSDGVLVAFHDASLDRVTDGAGASSRADLRRGAERPGRRRASRSRRWRSSSTRSRRPASTSTSSPTRPCGRWPSSSSAPRAAGPGAASARSPGGGCDAFRALAGGRRRRRRAAPVEVAAVRRLPAPGAPGWLDPGTAPRSRSRTAAGAWPIVTAGLVRRAHAAGVHVHVWTVDDPDEMRELLDRGVDGLMTDRTDMLRDVLRERGQWRDDERDRRPPASPTSTPLDRPQEQKAWYWYDWANSAYYTTVLSVLFAPYMITVAGRAAGCGDAGRHLRQDRRRARPAPGRRLAAVLPDQLRHHRQRVRAAGRRRDRRPLGAQEAAHGRLRVGRLVLRRAAVLHAGDQLAARRGRDRAEQHPRRLLAGQLLRDPGRHLHRGRARPGLVARLGFGYLGGGLLLAHQPR